MNILSEKWIGTQINGNKVAGIIKECLNPTTSTAEKESHDSNKLLSQHKQPKRKAKDHSTKKTFECNHCSKVLPNNYLLSVHLNSHTGEKPFRCSLCSQRYANPSSFHKHMKMHSGEMPFSCQYCGRCFGNRYRLSIHVNTHTGDRPYKCNECGKGFLDHSTRNRHVITVHSGERNFHCSYCDKKFKTKAHLDKHVKTHTESRIKCKLCKKLFKRHYLTVHYKRVHAKDLQVTTLANEDNRGSDDCPSFCTPNEIKCKESSETIQHVYGENSIDLCKDVHAEISETRIYKCNHCSRVFPNKGSLTFHMKRHSFPFKCSCGMKFSSKNQLTKHHAISHSDTKPFPCSLCDESFSLKRYLTQHCKEIHTKGIQSSVKVNVDDRELRSENLWSFSAPEEMKSNDSPQIDFPTGADDQIGLEEHVSADSSHPCVFKVKIEEEDA